MKRNSNVMELFFRRLRKNWFFPVSALACFYLNAEEMTFYIAGVGLCFLAAVFVAGNLPEDTEKNRFAQAAALLAAVGMAIFSYEHFGPIWETTYKAEILGRFFPAQSPYWKGINGIVAAVSVPFLYVVFLRIWNFLIQRLWNDRHLKSIGRGEGLTYAVLGLLLCTVVVVCFGACAMFYDPSLPYDLVYTSDSTELLKSNVFLFLFHPENDLRQPLFAVFASPLAGILFLFQWALGLDAFQTAIGNGVCQVLVLLLANFVLAGNLGGKGTSRACIVVLLSVMYASLLFVVVIEQYIIAFFWLMLLVDALKNRESMTLPLCGAGGTLLTSLAMAGMALEGRNIRRFVGQMVSCGLWFVGMLFLFGRYDLFSGFLTNAQKLGTFMGGSVRAGDKVLQYLSFVESCFFAPKAGAIQNLNGDISWQLLPVTQFNWIGFGLLVLSVVGFLRNRTDRLCQIAMYWVLFSVAILAVIGWGTAENGLILYSLYFGWAFFVLLYKLVSGVKGSARWHAAALGLAVLGMGLVNGAGLVQLVRFGAANYPG